MTDRDHFAAAALTGLLTSYTGSVPPDPRRVAQAAYQMADAMLEERGVQPAVVVRPYDPSTAAL